MFNKLNLGFFSPAIVFPQTAGDLHVKEGFCTYRSEAIKKQHKRACRSLKVMSLSVFFCRACSSVTIGDWLQVN